MKKHKESDGGCGRIAVRNRGGQMKQEILAAIQAAGVVGAGGAGFPTHVKTNASVETVLVNAAECEPLLQVDQQLLATQPAEMLEGLQAVMEAVGAQEGIIAVKGKHKAVVQALEARLVGSRIRLFILDDFYPAGDEQVTVYEALGRLVPQGGIPLQAGCVVVNVETLLNIAAALKGQSVTHTWVTITGQVACPATLRLPVGMSVQAALAAAGIASLDGLQVIDGGPMMGRLVADPAQPITKTTKGLLVLPEKHRLIVRRQLSFAAMARRARQSCIQCRQCTDLCPRYLLGHNIKPHLIMRSLLTLPGQEMAAKMALACCECGVCEQYVCPMELSPRNINAALKRQLLQRGIKPEPAIAGQQPHPLRSWRRLPVKRLISRLGLTDFNKPAPLSGEEYTAEQVAIPLKQHVGAPAQPLVVAGQYVTKGELIAQIPAGSLGAAVHASISGMVMEVNEAIVITAGKRSEVQ